MTRFHLLVSMNKRLKSRDCLYKCNKYKCVYVTNFTYQIENQLHGYIYISTQND